MTTAVIGLQGCGADDPATGAHTVRRNSPYAGRGTVFVSDNIMDARVLMILRTPGGCTPRPLWQKVGYGQWRERGRLAKQPGITDAASVACGNVHPPVGADPRQSRGVTAETRRDGPVTLQVEGRGVVRPVCLIVSAFWEDIYSTNYTSLVLVFTITVPFNVCIPL